jgi:long-chain acyl-CoA synthetase
MPLTYDQAVAAVTAPGSPLELAEAEVNGVNRTVFKHAPRSLREVFQGTKAHGDKTFLVYEDERYSFTEVMASVDALAHSLVHRYGVEKGDRVAIAMRNYPEWVISYAATLSIGAISVSLNSLWTEDELEYALGDSTPTVLIADVERVDRCRAGAQRQGCRIIAVRCGTPTGCDAWADVVHPGDALPDVDVNPDDDATILYTSGTTGRPKGAVSTHRAIVTAIMSFATRAAVETARTADRVQPPAESPSYILVVPLFHVTGCVPVMLGAFIGGAKLVMMYKWDAGKALELIERERVTTFVGVPTQSWDLVHSPRFADFDTSSLRTVGGGGAPAPPALVDKVEGSFDHGRPNIGYGMTETNAYGPGNTGDDYVGHPTSCGRVIPTMKIDVRDPDDQPLPVGGRGEIWFFGANLISGYWGKPEATAETLVDGWLRSGDIGRIDADGFVYVEDRVKDMILRGGENVYGAEVEAAIYDHPAIHEAAVYGVPDERLGEEVGVSIHLNDGMALTPDELRAFLAVKIAAFKIPKFVTFTSEPLPRNAAGKFLKRELRERDVVR